MRTSGMMCLALSAVLGFFSCSSVWAKGYSIKGNKVIVDTKDHWSSWTFPTDIVHITDDGRIQPRFIRKNINAALDAGEFVHGEDIRGGISAAGSNLKDAPNIIDGDLDTFWEPDISDLLRDWWVEIDLGRLVSVTKIVLRFVEEDKGDPFLQFKVLVANGDAAFAGTKLLDFKLVGKTTKLNRDQRVFEYDLHPIEKAGEGWTGAALQYIRVFVTDSRFYKAEEVSKEEYEALDSDRRGAIEYFRKTLPGKEGLITKEEYEALDPDQRGSIRYYRRELPRLAEVEVWSVGDNIGLGVLKRGGSVTATGVSIAADALDGDYTSKWDALVYSPYRDRGILTVDLGATFWVDTIRIISLPWGGLLEGYMVRGSDGSRAPDGSLIWEVMSPKLREDNPNNAARFSDDFQPRKLRLLDFKNIDITGRRAGGYAAFGTVSEFQIYGEGYVPEVTLTSDLIELGRTRNLTSIEWEGDSPPGTKIEIRTRTGDELREVKHFFNASGKKVTEREYNKLPGFARGPITSEFVPGGDWSGWSQIYLKSGDTITSPSPRKYLMIEVKLISNDPNLAPSLDLIAINFLPPVAREVVGEVSPDRDVSVGKPQDFSFFIRPTFLPASPGFDDILIQSSPAVGIELLGLSLGSEKDFLNNQTEDFLPDARGLFLSASGDTLDVLKDLADSLWVRLPDVVGIGDLDLIQVQFRSRVFLDGTVFEAFVANSSIANSWQRVDPGDATFFTSSRALSVSVPTGDTIIGDVRVLPNPFTPNGDGLNDEMEVRFTVRKVNTEKPVSMTIYSLGGELVKKFSECRFSAAGEYSISWAGEDDFGDMVPPGIYLCRISVDVDSGSAQNSSVGRLVYCAY